MNTQRREDILAWLYAYGAPQSVLSVVWYSDQIIANAFGVLMDKCNKPLSPETTDGNLAEPNTGSILDRLLVEGVPSSEVLASVLAGAGRFDFENMFARILDELDNLRATSPALA